jgi:hypothetical protein
MSLQRQRMEEGISEGQDAFWDEIIAELEWRSCRVRRPYRRCTCELCFLPPEEPY